MNARKTAHLRDSDFLFGSGAGHIAIAEDSLTARFFGGRLRALESDGKPVVGGQRIQGYVQTGEYNRFLETHWSTWFERDGDRGVQEESALEAPDGPIVVQTETVVLDAIPALIIRIKSELPAIGDCTLQRATPWRLLVHRGKGEPPAQKAPQDKPHLVRRLAGSHADAVVHVLEDDGQHRSAGIVTDVDPAGYTSVSFHPLWYLREEPLSSLRTRTIETTVIVHAPGTTPSPAQWKRIRRWVREARGRRGFFYNVSTSPE